MLQSTTIDYREITVTLESLRAAETPTVTLHPTMIGDSDLLGTYQDDERNIIVFVMGEILRPQLRNVGYGYTVTLLAKSCGSVVRLSARAEMWHVS